MDDFDLYCGVEEQDFVAAEQRIEENASPIFDPQPLFSAAVFGPPPPIEAAAATASFDSSSSSACSGDSGTPSPDFLATAPHQTVAPIDLFAPPSDEAAAVAAASAAPDEAAPTKKRRRKAEDGPAAEAAAAALAAEIGAGDANLLAMRTCDIEALIRARKAAGALSSEQERRLRRIRRLIKNREYAQSSRDKRKQAAGDMERELAAARDEARVLREQVAVLSARNAQLERENAELRRHGVPLQQPLPQRRVGMGMAAPACLLAVCLLGIGAFLLAPQLHFAGSQQQHTFAGRFGDAAGRTLLSTAEARGALTSFLRAVPQFIFGVDGSSGGGTSEPPPPPTPDIEYSAWIGAENGLDTALGIPTVELPPSLFDTTSVANITAAVPRWISVS